MPIFKNDGNSFPESSRMSERPVTDAHGSGLVRNLPPHSPNVLEVGDSRSIRVQNPILSELLHSADVVPVTISRSYSRDAAPHAIPIATRYRHPELGNLHPNVVRLINEAKPVVEYLKWFDQSLLGQPAYELPEVKRVMRDFFNGCFRVKYIMDLLRLVQHIIGKVVIDKLIPNNLSFQDMLHLFVTWHFDERVQVVRDTVVKYSLAIEGIRCADEDLMLAVYLYFEEQLGIKANIELCVRFHVGERSLVGVVLDSIVTAQEIWLEADSRLLNPEVKVMDNSDFEWIMQGFCRN